ncbi:MAG: response regulator [Polyangiaceae bacterium]|nr:response regulator [Polyangiaceae bacterium]
MPSPSPTATPGSAWFPVESLPALQDFWSTYEAGYEEFLDATLRMAYAHVEFGPILRALSPEDLARENEAGRDRLRRAIEGEWAPYEENLRVQGVMYAAMGVSIAGWYDIVKAFQRLLVPRLVDAYCSTPARLTAVLLVLEELLDKSMVLIAAAYFDAKERTLKQAEEEKAAVIHSALDPIVSMDERGMITEFNPAAELVFGRSRADTMGKELASIMIPERWREAHRQGLARYIQTGEGPVVGKRLELTALRADGTEFPIEVAIVSTPLRDGSPAFTGFLRDLTGRKRAEATRVRSLELEGQNRRIQEASRLKSEFLANMSHELRTPLNSIIGFAELLHDGEVDPNSAEHKEFLGDILRSGRHLLQLINDVLDLAKVEAGKLEFHPETVNLAALVQEVCSILRTTAAAKRIVLALEIDSRIGPLFIDAARLKQVLYNYLSNAIKFTPEGGRVAIVATEDGLEGFRLEVIDTGIGIAGDDLAKLFTEFQQLDAGAAKRHGGTGLGLALTKRLVEAQGGTIGVQSEPGRGSTFWVVLPRRTQGGRPLPEPQVIEAAEPHAPRILVVEDEPADLALIVRTLTAAGYAVETASTAAQAVARCRDTRFDAITLDLILPDMNGLQLLEAIRREGASTDARVVVVSMIAEKDVIGAFAVDDILAKPIDEAALVAALRRSGVAVDKVGRVLVVDDDDASLRLMNLTLTQLGYRVMSASDGDVALRLVERERPSAVVLDLVMPGVDGFEFLVRFRANRANRRVPVIVWTMKDLTGEESTRLRASAQGVLQKGQGTADLLDELRAFLPAPPVGGPDGG